MGLDNSPASSAKVNPWKIIEWNLKKRAFSSLSHEKLTFMDTCFFCWTATKCKIYCRVLLGIAFYFTGVHPVFFSPEPFCYKLIFLLCGPNLKQHSCPGGWHVFDSCNVFYFPVIKFTCWIKNFTAVCIIPPIFTRHSIIFDHNDWRSGSNLSINKEYCKITCIWSTNSYI